MAKVQTQEEAEKAAASGNPEVGGGAESEKPAESKAGTTAEAISKPQVVAAGKGNRPTRLHCPFAPQQGKANVALITKEGVELNIDLVDGIFTMPEKITDAEAHTIAAALKADGFRDLTAYPVPVVKPEDRIDRSIPREDRKRWRLSHPEYTANNRISGHTAVTIDNKDVSLDIKEGIIETDRLDVAQALHSSGFILVG